MKSLKVKGFYCRNFDLIAEFYYFCPICQDKFSVMRPCKHYDRSEPPEYVWLKIPCKEVEDGNENSFRS